jgi:PAS domain S-box-containing protein
MKRRLITWSQRRIVKNGSKSERGPEKPADTRRLLHELQVHQVELKAQNAELQEARDRMEVLLDKYTNLYDFAPVGYFSLDGQGRILEVNLTGAALLGVERARLINRGLPELVAPESRPNVVAFLKRVFTVAGKHVCEANLLRKGAAPFWAGLHGASVISLSGPGKSCRVAVSDITPLKQAEEAHHRLAALKVANEELKHLSRQVLRAQEEERKRISRELHDVIAQTLTGINVRLANLRKEAALNTKGLEGNIALTQELVEQSVNIVHRFARELRPAVLDDLGLIPALKTFVKHFSAETGIRVNLSALAAIEDVDDDKRTVLYRVAQEALTNVARHAQASSVELGLQKLEDVICMTIQDNGKGFRQEQVSPGKKGERLGLLGMRERLEMVGGSFTLSSAPGKGATVLAQIPLANLRHARGGGRPADGAR